MQVHEIRKQLKFSQDFHQLIGMLKNVAGQKYYAVEREKQRFDQFMDAFSKFFRVVNLAGIEDPLVRSATDVEGIVILTSDSGFMGGLNNHVLRRAMEIQGTRPDDKVALVVIGDKGALAIGDAGREHKAFPGIQEDTLYEQTLEIRDYLVQEVLAKRMGRVTVVYPQSLSFTLQQVTAINLLPAADIFDEHIETEVTERTHHVRIIAEALDVLVESDFKDILEYLVSVWVASKLYIVFEDSKLSEYSARAIHLEDSEQKLEEQTKKLKHQMFRASHEQIDKGIRESFSARSSRKRQRTRADGE